MQLKHRASSQRRNSMNNQGCGQFTVFQRVSKKLHGVQGVASSNLATPTIQPGFCAVMNHVLEGAHTPSLRA